MICIGTAFSDKQAGFAIATKIHKRLRNKILEVSYVGGIDHSLTRSSESRTILMLTSLAYRSSS